MRKRDREQKLAFININADDFDPDKFQATHEQLMARMHGVLPNGELISGPAVFRLAYQAIGLGWLTSWTKLPGFYQVSEFAYSIFAKNRLALGRLASRFLQ